MRLLVAVLVLLCATAQAGERLTREQVRERFSALAKELARGHADLAKALDKAGHRHEARIEFLLALSYDPGEVNARGALGYQRDGAGWKGAPGGAPASRGPIKGKLARRVEEARTGARVRLFELAQAAKTSGLEEEVRLIAGHALDEDARNEEVRQLLAHEKAGPAWTSPREQKLRAAFARCRDAVKVPEPKGTDAALGASLGASPLVVRETARAVFYESTAAAGKDGQADLVRSLEVTRAAWRHLLDKGDASFYLDEPPATPPPDDPPPAANRPRFLVLAASEHEAFVTRAVEEPRRPLARQLRSWSGWMELSTGKVFTFECALAPANRSEWLVLNATKTLLVSRVPKAAPGFLVEGLTRFFGGHVTGRAEISYVNTRESKTVRERAALGFDDLRARVRGVFQLALEGDLGKVLAKPLNDFSDDDSVVAFAFVDMALERHRKELRELLPAIAPDRPTIETVERCFGKTVRELEGELRDWVRAEY